MKTKQGTLRHHNHENKTMQSKTRNTKTLQEWKQKNTIKNEEHYNILHVINKTLQSKASNPTTYCL